MAINEDIRGLGARVRLKNDRRKNKRWKKPYDPRNTEKGRSGKK